MKLRKSKACIPKSREGRRVLLLPPEPAGQAGFWQAELGTLVDSGCVGEYPTWLHFAHVHKHPCGSGLPFLNCTYIYFFAASIYVEIVRLQQETGRPGNEAKSAVSLLYDRISTWGILIPFSKPSISFGTEEDKNMSLMSLKRCFAAQRSLDWTGCQPWKYTISRQCHEFQVSKTQHEWEQTASNTPPLYKQYN